jgi:hypothetical protein
MIGRLLDWIHRKRHGHEPAWVVTAYDGLELTWGCMLCGARPLSSRDRLQPVDFAERVARAAFLSLQPRTDHQWDQVPEPIREHWRRRAKAIIAIAELEDQRR